MALSFSSSATYKSLQSSKIMITVSNFLCVFQQVFRRKQITKTWPSVIPRKTVCNFVRFCILSQCTKQIPQSPVLLIFTKLGCIIAQSCLLQERSRFLSQKEKKAKHVSHPELNPHILSQVWNISVWGCLPCPQTEPWLQHCR